MGPVLEENFLYSHLYGLLESFLPASFSWIAYLVAGLMLTLLIVNGLMILAMVFMYMERRVLGRFQSRIGPNRVGPFGLLQPIADALISAHKKGVKINVLTDQRSLVKYMQDNQTTYSQSVLEYLFDNGIERVAIYLKTLFHHKVIIADDVVVLGSLNLFKKSIHEHAESIIFIKSDKTCEFYRREFESRYKDALDLQSAMDATKDQPRD